MRCALGSCSHPAQSLSPVSLSQSALGGQQEPQLALKMKRTAFFRSPHRTLVCACKVGCCWCTQGSAGLCLRFCSELGPFSSQ